MKTFNHQIETLLGDVDVKINGSRPWDIKVHNEEFTGFFHGAP